MDADDFQELYKLLRGSRAAIAVLDARALFSESKMVDALEKLAHAKQIFVEGRSRLLKQDAEQQVDPKSKDADKQIKKLKRKQEKLLKCVEAFDELLPALQKLADRERSRAKRQESAKQKPTQPKRAESDQTDASQMASGETVARPSEISKEFVAAYRRAEGDDRLDVVNERFGFRAVSSEADIHGNALYYIHTGEQSLLVRTSEIEPKATTVGVVSAVDDRPIQRISRDAFLKLGTGRQLVLLTRKATEDGDDAESGGEGATTDGSGTGSAIEVGNEGHQNVLDMGAFGQLLSAAQRSGMVSGADQIAHVRDREFRLGKYDLAFQAIDALYGRFSASASQRTQRLSREDAEIGAGRIKISPKDLQAKRARDRQQTQEIERANRRFQVVLEGLRILMNRETAD